MAIGPVGLGILAGMGGAAIQNLPELLPNSLERKQKERMKELERMAELEMLGLTEQERNVMENRMSARSQQASDYSQAQRARFMAGSGASQGQALEGAMAADEVRARQETAAQQVIEEADLQRQQQQEEELAALQAAVGEEQKQNVAAVASILGAGLEGGITTSSQQRLFQSPKGGPSASVVALSKAYGISEDEARGLLELSALNPELLTYMGMLQGDD